MLLIMNKFAERLKELRQERHLSQRELGLKINVSQAAIARWEANLQVPNIDAAISVAQFFGVTVDYLLGLQDFR